jgi:aldehyde dehydrogenase (NAD+)
MPLEVTARRIAWGRFINAGQICVAPDYVLIAEPLRLAFLESLGRAILRFYGPNPQASTSYGRIVNQQHFTRLVAFMGEGRTAIGGSRDAADRYIAPTVLTDLPAGATVMQEEIFGPILPVIGYQTMEEAVAFIRQRPKPLTLYLFTRDRSLQSRILRDTSSGSVVVNDVVVNQIAPDCPLAASATVGRAAFTAVTPWMLSPVPRR